MIKRRSGIIGLVSVGSILASLIGVGVPRAHAAVVGPIPCSGYYYNVRPDLGGYLRANIHSYQGYAGWVEVRLEYCSDSKSNFALVTVHLRGGGSYYGAPEYQVEGDTEHGQGDNFSDSDTIASKSVYAPVARVRACFWDYHDGDRCTPYL